MPRILELKEIDGAMWAKLDIDMASEVSPVSLYTEEEVQGVRKSERAHCRWLIEQCDMPSGWKARAVDALRG